MCRRDMLSLGSYTTRHRTTGRCRGSGSGYFFPGLGLTCPLGGLGCFPWGRRSVFLFPGLVMARDPQLLLLSPACDTAQQAR